MSVLSTIFKCLVSKAEHLVQRADKSDQVVVKTTRYLRVGMVGLVAGLGAALLYEHRNTGKVSSGSCWQGSISAYYYTPVQAFFVAALVAIGISLVCLKGNTDVEDVLLNFAGFLAPVVAFVPTPNHSACSSVPPDPRIRPEDLAAYAANVRSTNVANNGFALLVLAGLGLLFLIFLVALHTIRPPHDQAGNVVKENLSGVDIVGCVLAVLLYVAAWRLFTHDRPWVLSHGHSMAANTMFVFIFLAVVENALNLLLLRRRHQDRARSSLFALCAYTGVAVLMVAAFVLFDRIHHFASSPYATIWLEASMISLFAVFWIIQTAELWSRGLRTRKRPKTPRPHVEAAVPEPV